MNDVAVTALLNGGGVLAFAYVVWRAIADLKTATEKGNGEIRESIEDGDAKVAAALDRVAAKLDRFVERLARIDDRTYRAEADDAPRKRTRTPISGVPRSKTQTPFTGDDE